MPNPKDATHPDTQRIYGSLLVAQEIQREGPFIHLANVGPKTWTLNGDEGTIDFDAYFALYFLNARRGAHSIKFVIANGEGARVHLVNTSPVEVPGHHYSTALIAPFRNVRVPLGLLTLYGFVGEDVRGATPLHILREGDPRAKAEYK